MRWALGIKCCTECRSTRPCLGIAHQTVRRFLHIHLTVHDSQRLWLGEALSLRKRNRWSAAVPGRRQANPKYAPQPCPLEKPRQAARRHVGNRNGDWVGSELEPCRRKRYETCAPSPPMRRAAAALQNALNANLGVRWRRASARSHRFQKGRYCLCPCVLCASPVTAPPLNGKRGRDLSRNHAVLNGPAKERAHFQ